MSYAGEVDGGKQTLEWDGTTILGLPARPGAYAVRGIWFAEPLKASFKMKVGVSGDPPYVLDNGRAVGRQSRLADGRGHVLSQWHLREHRRVPVRARLHPQMHVWTDTGRYVGKVYHDPNDRIMDANSISSSLAPRAQAHVGLHLAGDHGVSVHEIALPKLVAVGAGAITVAPEMAAAARPWDPMARRPAKPVYIARAICEQDPQQKKLVDTGTIEIDGKLDDWAGVQAAEIVLEGKPVATLRTVFDAENLYLAYDVRQRDGLRNAGTELPLSPFASGGYVDFCIGRDWSLETPRDADAEGDVRVILARITGDAPADYQMAFWPVRKNGKNPQTISSPAATRSFADIAPLPGLKFAYQLGADGYTLEAAVPLKSLNSSRTATRWSASMPPSAFPTPAAGCGPAPHTGPGRAKRPWSTDPVRRPCSPRRGARSCSTGRR